MGLLGRLPTRIFLLKKSAQRTLECPRVLEGRQLLILVDRVDIGWRKSSSPLGGRKYCGAVEDCKVVLFLSQEPETGGSPSSRYLGRLLAPNKNRHHDQPGEVLDHHACDDSVHHGMLRGGITWELDLRRTGYATSF